MELLRLCIVETTDKKVKLDINQISLHYIDHLYTGPRR